MTCALCSAAVFGPMVQNGVSVRKICERAIRSAEPLDHRGRSYVQALADTANLLAAEVARLQAERVQSEEKTDE